MQWEREFETWTTPLTAVKKTLANLESEEKAIADCMDGAQQVAGSLREHVYNIKRDELWSVLKDCDSFKDYCGLKRIRFAGKKIELSYTRLTELATTGEVEQQIPKIGAPNFSDDSLLALSKLRITYKDKLTGKVKKTHGLVGRPVVGG